MSSEAVEWNAVEKQELVAGYEELRRGWLDQALTERRGLTLFLRRGMSAWIYAWRECVPGKPRRGEGLPDSSRNILPSGVYADTVSVLAEMAMATLKEMEL